MSKIIINLAGRKRTGKESAYKLLLPYLKSPEEFQFATPLKKFCIETLGLTHDQCYGPSEDRETPTKYMWGDVAPWIREKYGKHPDEVMTARAVLQVVGTDIMRQSFYKDIWAEAGILQAMNSTAHTCIFTDCRFINELEVTRRVDDCIIIRLYRQTGLVDAHDSETALDELDLFTNQREISPSDCDALDSRGYDQITKTLWKSREPEQTMFDYLVDNNYTLDTLRHSMVTILKDRGLFVEPTLS